MLPADAKGLWQKVRQTEDVKYCRRALKDHSKQFTLAEWQDMGVRTIYGSDLPSVADPDFKASLIMPAGVDGPAFLTYKNFRAILSYNCFKLLCSWGQLVGGRIEMTHMRKLLIVVFCLSLVACGSARRTYDTTSPNPTYKVGKPYKVAGKVYRPVADPHYNRTGLASWYGSKFHGRKTANGDVFNMNALTAAHTTLPMPSYVRVTNLDNGRWLILLVNDRGPFVGNRLIDVSRRAAQLLGFEKKGVTRVRVQAVDGPRGALPKQTLVEKTTPSRKPPVVQQRQHILVEKLPDHQQSDAGKNIYVQIGAYSDEKNAKKILDAIHHISDTRIDKVDINGQNLYRVRIGPQPTLELAEIILGRILSLGHNTARIIRDY